MHSPIEIEQLTYSLPSAKANVDATMILLGSIVLLLLPLTTASLMIEVDFSPFTLLNNRTLYHNTDNTKIIKLFYTIIIRYVL